MMKRNGRHGGPKNLGTVIGWQPAQKEERPPYAMRAENAGTSSDPAVKHSRNLLSVAELATPAAASLYGLSAWQEHDFFRLLSFRQRLAPGIFNRIGD